MKCNSTFFLTFALPIFLFATQCAAQSPNMQNQDIAQIREAVEYFVYNNTSTLPGQVSVSVDKIDQRLILARCPALEPFIPPGSRLWGRTSIGVRCDTPEAIWTIYVQTDISIMADVLHAARSIPRGHALTDADIAPQNVNLAQMPDGLFTEPSQVLGKVATTHLTAGQPIRPQVLRAPYVIQRGQKVSLVAQGRGFSISSEGQALTDAAEGGVVQVRIKSGRIITGVARGNSTVEIQP